MDSPVELDALAEALPALGIRALAGNPDLADALLPRGCFDFRDRRAEVFSKSLERQQQIGLEGDREIAIHSLRVERGLAQHTERAYRQRERLAFVTTEREQRT